MDSEDTPVEEGADDAGLQWYVLVGEEQYGPLAEEAIADMITTGQVGPSTMVWCEGAEDWMPLEAWPQFAAAFEGVGAELSPQLNHKPRRQPATSDDGKSWFQWWLAIIVGGIMVQLFQYHQAQKRERQQRQHWRQMERQIFDELTQPSAGGSPSSSDNLAPRSRTLREMMQGRGRGLSPSRENAIAPSEQSSPPAPGTTYQPFLPPHDGPKKPASSQEPDPSASGSTFQYEGSP